MKRFAGYGGLFALLLIAVLPFERTPSYDLVLFGSSITLRLSSIVSVLFLAVSLPLVWEKRFLIKKMPYLGLGVFLLVYLLSVGLASDFSRAIFVYAFTCLTIITGAVLSLYVDDKFLEQAKKALYWSTWIVLAFGFYQYIGDILGLSTAWTGLRADYTKVVFGFPRIQSVGIEPLYYANFLLIPFFVFAADFLSGKKEKSFLLIAIITQISLSVSRGAFAGAIIGLVVLVIFALRNRAKVMQFAGLFSFVVFGVLLALLMTNIEVKRGDGNLKESGEKKAEAIVAQATNFDTQDDRDRNRDLAWSAFTQKPIFGWGPGGFDSYARSMTDVYDGTEGRLIVNNEPLELLAEGGLISFVSLLITMLWVLWRSTKLLWQRQAIGVSLSWVMGLVCYLTALAVQYQTFSTLYIMHIWVAIGLLIGAVNFVEQKSQNKVTRAKK